MALPRTSVQQTFSAAAGRIPAANDTFTAITTGTTTVFTFALPRSFKPQRPTRVLFPAGLQAGLSVGPPTVTGNSPSTGASVKGYTLNLPISNNSGGTLTPTAQKITVIQD